MKSSSRRTTKKKPFRKLYIGVLAVIAVVAASYIPAQSQEANEGQRAEKQGRRRAQDNNNQPEQQEQKGQNRKRNDALVLPPDVAALNRLSVILGRPSDKSISANILSAEPLEAYLDYGTVSGSYGKKTNLLNLNASQPVEIDITGLAADQHYFYRLRYRKPGTTAFEQASEHDFHTQRAKGSSFSFEIQGDSHPERGHQFASALYAQTLRAAAADKPDFYMTIGDDFSVDTLQTVNPETVAQRYLLQRPFLSLIGQTAPLFLVNGNHEQAAAANLDGTPDNVAVWAQNARNKYFPQPAPDGFYTGNSMPVKHIGLLRNYYSWTWGDALFVVIDPYWHSTTAVDNQMGSRDKKNRDLWEITIGNEQYTWLKQALETSKAKYKFVFAHHVLGTGRGGIEQAGLYEWGGKNKRGDDEFAQKRPGWEMPIHPLMAKNGVSIFFQGHDHVFARQELDGVVYQTLPEPADPNYKLYFEDAYHSGKILPSSGRVRVSVSAEKVRVDYVRSYLPKDASTEHPDGEIAFSYDVIKK